jgi:hypothetical protein
MDASSVAVRKRGRANLSRSMGILQTRHIEQVVVFIVAAAITALNEAEIA